MKQQDNIEKKIEEILNSLNGIQCATPAPYLLTRLQVRLSKKASLWESISTVLNRPSIALTTVFFILALNSFVFLNQRFSSSTENSPSADLSEQHINNVYDFTSKTNNALLTIWNVEYEQDK